MSISKKSVVKVLSALDGRVIDPFGAVWHDDKVEVKVPKRFAFDS